MLRHEKMDDALASLKADKALAFRHATRSQKGKGRHAR
jgi:hypothetical protein